MSLLAPTGKNATIPALLKHGGYSRSANLPRTTHLTITWRQAAAKGKKGVVLANLSVTIAGGHVVTIKVGLTKQGRLVLSRSRRVRIAANGTLSMAGVPPVNGAKTFAVTRTGH